MRRTIRFLAAVGFCVFGAFSTLVAGLLVYTHGHKVEAQVSAFFTVFFDVFAHGDMGKMIEAMTGAPFALGCFLGPLAFGWLLERKRKSPGSFRHGAKLNRVESTPGETWARTAAALSASGDYPDPLQQART